MFVNPRSVPKIIEFATFGTPKSAAKALAGISIILISVRFDFFLLMNY